LNKSALMHMHALCDCGGDGDIPLYGVFKLHIIITGAMVYWHWIPLNVDHQSYRSTWRNGFPSLSSRLIVRIRFEKPKIWWPRNSMHPDNIVLWIVEDLSIMILYTEKVDRCFISYTCTLLILNLYININCILNNFS
jgi:hypothetical protein